MTELINPGRKQKKIIMIGLTLSVLLAALDSTIVSTAMKNISDALNGFDLYAWPLTIYMLFSTVITPISGKLADTFGRKLFFIIGSFTFLAGSMLCGLSQSMMQLIIFRAIQGIGGGTLMANTFAMIGDVFPPEERAKNTGVVFSAFGLASIIGPVLGGVIAEHFGWRWVFYINLPIGILFITLILVAVPSDKKDTAARRRVDYAGTIALILGLTPMLLAFTWAGKKYSWLSAQVLIMFAFSFIMLAAFGFIEKKAEEPIFPLTLFKDKTFRVSTVAAFLSNATMFGAVLFIPLYAQVVLGESATNSGMATAPMMISFVIASFISGQAISKTGKLKFFAVAGFVVTAIGIFILTRLNAESTIMEVAAAMTVSGMGIGINMPVFTLAVQNVFPQSKMGVVTASVQFFRNIGGTIASAVFGIIMLSSISSGIDKIDLGILSTSDTSFDYSAIIKDPEALVNTNTITTFKKQVPASLMADFNILLEQIKDILSSAIHNVFITSLIIAVAAIAVSLLLPDISVRKNKSQTVSNGD
ncbi:MAG: MFS transporter [Clostridia bacterium]|nr:MFS transporter [Clostridia bacterium]